MASISSTSSTTSSLSGTLRGFGGMASGIDRDSIIEQMSMGTNTKIANQKKSITSLTWKQEAFRSIIDKILDLQDNYLSYAATKSVTDSNTFAKSVITANGDEKISKYVSVSGSSDLLESMSVKGVSQLATAANVQSKEMGSGAIETGMSYSDQPLRSSLSGRKLVFGHYSQTDGRFNEVGTFTFPSSYKVGDETKQIDYTNTNLDELAKQLNEAVAANEFTLKDGYDTSQTTIKFTYDEKDDKLGIEYVSIDRTDGKFQLGSPKNFDEQIQGSSSALSALGFSWTPAEGEDGKAKDAYTLEEFNAHISKSSTHIVDRYDNMAQYLKGESFKVTYGGQSKQVELITKEDAEALEEERKRLEAIGLTPEEKTEKMNKAFAEKMQKHLDKAFGTGKIIVGSGSDGITFDTKDKSVTLTVTSSSYAVMKETGLDKMSSNKISLDSSLYDNRKRLGFGNEYDGDGGKEKFEQYLKDNGFKINGVEIKVTADMSVNQLLTKINSSEAGVKATYLNTSNKFTLVSTETGSGREISLTGAAGAIFRGGTMVDGQYTGGKSTDGQDAVMYVDYGTGEAERIVSSSNTFNMDGLQITVSGEFGIEKDTATGKPLGVDGKPLDETAVATPTIPKPTPKFDNTQSITFTASADVDKATEAVKKFLEDYNALVKAINTEITTKPDKSYGPLTDEQKDEMNETSIENWEKKAKSGLLYNNSIMRDLSLDVQGVLTKVMGNGITYDDLEKVGITMSEDPYDGGTLKFDEEKFKAAMKDDPEKVGRVFAGDGGSNKGLGQVVNDTLKTYATRYTYLNGGSYGRLVEEAGSEKCVLSLQKNTIYNQLKDMQESLTSLQSKLKTEQDRYIQMFTTMEKAISSMNSQSSYLSSISG